MGNISKKSLIPLPRGINFETVEIYKALASASRALAELKGTTRSLLNQYVLIDTLSLQEALANSKIKNIATIQDQVFKARLFTNASTVATKAVARYQRTLRLGYNTWLKQQCISEKMLIDMFQLLKKRGDAYRKIPGTVLRNERTGKVIYTPPQGVQQIVAHMRDLEAFINDHIIDHKHDGIDPLIKMALIHRQFESIHPFHDGNGRIGRVLNVLYLIHTGLLDAPMLYLSRAINRSKPKYYRLLQATHEGVWEDWIIYMLNTVTVTANSTLKFVVDIRDLIQTTKHRMRKELKFYSQDLLNMLFRHPYTQIDDVAKELGIHHNTAASYLKKLTATKFVTEEKYGAKKYYINHELISLFSSIPEDISKIETYQ